MMQSRDLLHSIRTSFTEPARAAREVIDLDLPRSVLWQGLALASVLTTLLMVAAVGGSLEMPVVPGLTNTVTPFAFAVIHGASAVLMIFALHYTGLTMGGSGLMGASIAVVVLFLFVGVAMQVALLAVNLLSPVLAGFFSLAAAVIQMWILASFVSETHGFPSPWKGLGVLILAVILMTVGLGLLTSLIGAMFGLDTMGATV